MKQPRIVENVKVEKEYFIELTKSDIGRWKNPSTNILKDKIINYVYRHLYFDIEYRYIGIDIETGLEQWEMKRPYLTTEEKEL